MMYIHIMTCQVHGIEVSGIVSLYTKW